MKSNGRLRSPIGYFGGKGRMVAKLLPLLPPHKRYCEPFGGGASLLFAKEPAEVETYNDIDSGLVNLFRVLRDEVLFPKFLAKVKWMPYSREEFYHCRETWEATEDPVERAVRWFTIARQNMGGMLAGSWGFAVTDTGRGMASTCSRWLSTQDQLSLIHQRLMRVQVEHDDFRNILATYDTPDTLFYCDPPYVHETRSETRYTHELTLQDHQDLVEVLLGLKGMAILSGYKHEIYQPLEENGWEKREFKTACHAAGKTRASGLQGKGTALCLQPRTEVVWRSPNCLVGQMRFAEVVAGV